METQTGKAFGFRDKIGYMFGDFGNDFTFILSSMFLLKFYTDIMGVSAGLVGLMMMLARFLDAFTDVAMGQIVDRSSATAQGKFVPWIRRMSGPVAVASFLMYGTWFRNMDMGFKVFWMFFTYLMWGSVCYTGINIPYGSMASAITADPEERAQLSNWRTIGATLASAMIGVVLPLVVYYEDRQGNSVMSGTRMSMAALACSIGALLCYVVCCKLTTERVKVGRITQKFRVRELIGDLLHNRALIGMVAASICLLVAQLTLGTMSNYIYPNYFGNVQAQSVAGVVSTIVTLLCATFTVKVSAAWGRKELSVLSALFSGGILMALYFMKTDNAWVFVGMYTLANVGVAIFTLICWAMIADVIDDTEVRTGKRADGTIYAVYSFARKLGQAATSGLTGLLLGWIGYSQATAYDPEVTRGIYDITCLIPALGFFLLAIVLQFLYPLNRKRMEENVYILKQRKLEQQSKEENS